jgi:hypothetical protein
LSFTVLCNKVYFGGKNVNRFSFFCLGILVLAFAVIAPTAQAAEFEVTLDMDRDRNTAGGLQLRHPNPSNVMEARVNFQQAVELEATDISISGFDMDDNYLPYVVLVPAGGNYPNGAISPHDRASNSFRIWIRVSPETAKVKLKIAKGIDSADAFNDDTSKELSVDIGLIAEDEEGPVAGHRRG